MLKNILNLNGAQLLSNHQLKRINGGGPACSSGYCTQSGVSEGSICPLPGNDDDSHGHCISGCCIDTHGN